MEYYSAVKRNELGIYPDTERNLPNIMVKKPCRKEYMCDFIYKNRKSGRKKNSGCL